MNLLKEFKPALIFLGKFLALYLTGNILYGLYIESYEQAPDAVTHIVTSHTSAFLNAMGYETGVQNAEKGATVGLKQGGLTVLSVFEGCNGVNVMIVFIAFLFAFGGPVKAFSFFLPAGLVIIHTFNLLRISLLFWLALDNSSQFYYYHKYFFTAILYLVVFGLWTLWVVLLHEKRNTDNVVT